MQLLEQKMSCGLHPFMYNLFSQPMGNRDVGRDTWPPEGKRDFCHWLQCSQDPPVLFLLP